LKTENVYRSLAKRLDEIPNGFASSGSGIELELLAKMYAPEEARLASVMKLTPEPASEIGARVDVDRDCAYEMLNVMVGKGLIRASRGDDELLFGLMPFVVGVYEEQLPRMDEEMAELFERYYQETSGGGMVQGDPPVHRIIPVAESIPVELEIHPHEQAREFLEKARSWGVRDCICRVQQKKVGKGCDHTLENCIIFAPVPNAFEGSDVTRSITKEEALGILAQAAEEGLVHSSGNFKDQLSYICNCCTCCCGILRGVVEFRLPNAVARSDFRIVVDQSACTGCGLCVERCQFGALSVVDGASTAENGHCLGCGACVPACPVDALALERRPKDEAPRTPANRREWMARRAAKRGKSLTDML
jgi:electron transport complex protein RnfB